MAYDIDLFAGTRLSREPAAPPMSWHDSTWDLRRGLEVLEDVPGELLPAEWRQAEGR
jgi:hypothetical protein